MISRSIFSGRFPVHLCIVIAGLGGYHRLDKEYNELNGQLFFRDTHLPEMLSRSRHTLDASVETLMMVDSLLMTDEDRARIAAECRKAKEDRIVITHGTDTMPVTAKALEDQVPGKTIVLTGAMIPYTFGSSDGFFNLGCALAFVQSLPPGVYVVMNGRCFQAGRVRKDTVTGRFEELTD
jgi:L-asparaginase